ncbi:MAG: type II toxin-antitoxin system VapC family toxin [Bacteroidales bacterium]|nr:type II toxin-antitoxin system VapC family toxin [Bacteroidales bacterium]
MHFFNTHTIEIIYIAEITKIEFSSVVWKKCRKKEIDVNIAQSVIDKFEIDLEKFNAIEDNIELKNSARVLIGKHWQKGLRTLDSIQLASALTKKASLDFMFTSDKLLSEIAVLEGVKIG